MTDNGPATKLASQSTEPAREDVEEFHFSAISADTDVDLERSRSGTAADLSYDHATGVLKAINGAKVALYATYSWWTKPGSEKDYPSENECRNKRPEDWKENVNKDDLNSRYSSYCIKTAENDLGYLFIEPDFDKKPDSYYVYTYTWVR